MDAHRSQHGRTTPKARYREDVARENFLWDAAQQQAIDALEDLHRRILNTPKFRSGVRGWYERRRGIVQPAPTGLYLWGGVGRGKTYLMDLFYECLPDSVGKHRVHFYRFMQDAHERLNALRQQEDPLRALAMLWAQDARVLCFDEFLVGDIGDAMILSGLLHGLVEAGVTLVATSNVPPDQLYADGLQRQRFMPAIELLEANTQVLNVDSGTDYRLRLLSQAAIYHVPDDHHAQAAMAAAFESLCPDRDQRPTHLTINHREITAYGVGDGVLWSSFSALCEGPRSQDDYVEIARQFHTVLLSAVPIMDREREDAARRFIALVDEFYDRGVNLLISATAYPDWLYRGLRQSFEFKRTVSRLQEMQSEQYLAAAHRP